MLLLLESNCGDRIAARPQLLAVEVALRCPQIGARQEAILGFIRAGVPNVHAAQLSGISETTFYEWLSKAQGKTEKNDARFPEFLESLKEAEAGFIESNLGVIRRAATESSVTKREHIRGTTPKGPRKSSKSGRGVVCGPARSPSIASTKKR